MKYKVKKYKSTRKYRCPFCRLTATRGDLAAHVEKDHEDMIPEGYNGTRVVYDYINKKNYGTCLICKQPVYEWDDNIARYKNICNNPACLEALKQKAQGNHFEDPEVQKKMLAGRKISGIYKFKDGTIHSYVGTYELRCFEFMDSIGMQGKDIMSTGPTVYYEYNGETHPWILDWMYIPALLCCDVKDGGSNPNNRPMVEYRERQLAKEEAIKKLGQYNYIRLTDNNFGQLLSALADIRYGTIHEDPIAHIYIHENDIDEKNQLFGMSEVVGCLPSASAHADYVIPRLMGGLTFEDRGDDPAMYFGNTGSEYLVSYDREMNPMFDKKNEKLLGLTDVSRIVLPYNRLTSFSEKQLKEMGEQGLLEALIGKEFNGWRELLTEKVVKVSDDIDNDFARALVLNGIVNDVRVAISEYKMDPTDMAYVSSNQCIGTLGHVIMMKDADGFYACTPDDYHLVSNHYETKDDLLNVVDMMNQMYNSYLLHNGKEDKLSD